MIGAGGILKHPTCSDNFGYAYGKGSGRELLPIVKARIKDLSGDLDPQLTLFTKKVYVDKRSLNKNKDLAKAVTQILDLLAVDTT